MNAKYGNGAYSELVLLSHRVHLYPFRTQKLSCAEPKILDWRRSGKIGQCQHKCKETLLGKTLKSVLLPKEQLNRSEKVGVTIAQGPPVPIPNTEVKLCGAEDTCLATSRENRSMPTFFHSIWLILFLYSELAQLAEHLTVNQVVAGSSPAGGASRAKASHLACFFLFSMV